MGLRLRILLLAILPLIVSLVLIALAVQRQAGQLTQREHDLVEATYMDARRSELANYVALAASTIRPLHDRGGEGDREAALALLASLDFGPDGYFFVYRLDGTVLMHSRQPELVGRNLIGLIDPLGRPTIQQLIARAREGGGFIEYFWPRPSTGQTEAKLGYVIALEDWDWMLGTGLYLGGIETTLAGLSTEAGRNISTTLVTIAGVAALAVGLICASGLALNLSEHRSAETRLRLLARQVQQSQEEERARLARELHDGVSQMLVSTKLLVEAAAESGQPAPLTTALAQLNASLVEIRRISHHLRPALLDTLGLPAALQHLAREVAEATGIPVVTTIEGELPPLAAEIKTALFRVAQESLTNVARHAGAGRVELDLVVEENGGLGLSIRDDGGGFDDHAVHLDPERGIGLRNMRERLAAIGGRLEIQSRPGAGTRVLARLPRAGLAGPDTRQDERAA